MKKSIFLSFLFALFFSGGFQTVYACSCVPSSGSLDTDVKKAYRDSSAVFSGEVTEIVRRDDYVRVKVRVEKSWKGRAARTVTIRTGFNDGDCGYQFAKGKKYLIYTFNSLQTNLCTRTAELGSSEDIKLLDKLKKRSVRTSPK